MNFGFIMIKIWRIFYDLGNGLKWPCSKQKIKCSLKYLVLNCKFKFPVYLFVQNSIAKRPQSILLSCCWISRILMLIFSKLADYNFCPEREFLQCLLQQIDQNQYFYFQLLQCFPRYFEGFRLFHQNFSYLAHPSTCTWIRRGYLL